MVALGMPWQGPDFAVEAEEEVAPACCTGAFVDHEAYVSLAEWHSRTGNPVSARPLCTPSRSTATGSEPRQTGPPPGSANART